jgi:hypothetical protein
LKRGSQDEKKKRDEKKQGGGNENKDGERNKRKADEGLLQRLAKKKVEDMAKKMVLRSCLAEKRGLIFCKRVFVPMYRKKLMPR